MERAVRVLIVDDSAFVRRAVERMLSAEPRIEVAGTASNGAEAVALTRTLRPDVVILDVNMPEVDGLDALSQIMSETPTGVLMLSTLTSDGASTTMRALDLGAVDFIDKSSAGTSMDIYGLAPVLREKVLAVAGATLHRDSLAFPSPPAGAALAEAAPERTPLPCPYDLVVVGTSTGGPRALVELVSRLPADFGAAVVVAQHMPAGFTHTLAERLNRHSALSIGEAKDGEPIVPGRALVAPGGTQMSVERVDGGLVARVHPGPPGLLHRPCVDLLFESVAEVVGSRAIGVVLTGMGDDGARGLRALRSAGARTVVESESTAVIYGMPRAAAPAAERVLPIHEIGPALVALCTGAATDPDRSD